MGEQWINIKFCVKISNSASETLALLTMAHGKYAVNRHRRFKEQRKDVQDNPRSEQPKTQRRDANVDKVRTFVPPIKDYVRE
jgi:hypothetical protein